MKNVNSLRLWTYFKLPRHNFYQTSLGFSSQLLTCKIGYIADANGSIDPKKNHCIYLCVLVELKTTKCDLVCRRCMAPHIQQIQISVLYCHWWDDFGSRLAFRSIYLISISAQKKRIFRWDVKKYWLCNIITLFVKSNNCVLMWATKAKLSSDAFSQYFDGWQSINRTVQLSVPVGYTHRCIQYAFSTWRDKYSTHLPNMLSVYVQFTEFLSRWFLSPSTFLLPGMQQMCVSSWLVCRQSNTKKKYYKMINN